MSETKFHTHKSLVNKNVLLLIIIIIIIIIIINLLAFLENITWSTTSFLWNRKV
jgi:hypothetical protein